MKCCDCCNYGPILSDEALNDRLYWVEIITGPYEGTKCAAWRNDPGGGWNWVVDFSYDGLPLDFPDGGIRVIHEIIPEE